MAGSRYSWRVSRSHLHGYFGSPPFPWLPKHLKGVHSGARTASATSSRKTIQKRTEKNVEKLCAAYFVRLKTRHQSTFGVLRKFNRNALTLDPHPAPSSTRSTRPRVHDERQPPAPALRTTSRIVWATGSTVSTHKSSGVRRQDVEASWKRIPAHQEGERGGNTTSTPATHLSWRIGRSVKVEHALAEFQRAQEENHWASVKETKKTILAETHSQREPWLCLLLLGYTRGVPRFLCWRWTDTENLQSRLRFLRELGNVQKSRIRVQRRKEER